MKVWIITTTYNEFVGIYSSEEEAMKMADWLEATDKYPIDSLYVDDYYVE